MVFRHDVKEDQLQSVRYARHSVDLAVLSIALLAVLRIEESHQRVWPLAEPAEEVLQVVHDLVVKAAQRDPAEAEEQRDQLIYEAVKEVHKGRLLSSHLSSLQVLA